MQVGKARLGWVGHQMAVVSVAGSEVMQQSMGWLRSEPEARQEETRRQHSRARNFTQMTTNKPLQ